MHAIVERLVYLGLARALEHLALLDYAVEFERAIGRDWRERVECEVSTLQRARLRETVGGRDVSRWRQCQARGGDAPGLGGRGYIGHDLRLGGLRDRRGGGGFKTSSIEGSWLCGSDLVMGANRMDYGMLHIRRARGSGTGSVAATI